MGNDELMSTCEQLQDVDFALLSALIWRDGNIELLDLHIERLREAHRAFADAGAWCARVPFPAREDVERAVTGAIERSEPRQTHRVSLKLSCDGLDATASAPFVMGDHVYRLSLDSQATSYESLFMQHKTTERAAYKDAAVRAGATLSSTDGAAPFDVVMYNQDGFVTETSIANCALKLPSSDTFCTPPLSTGCLNGVGRRVAVNKDHRFKERLVHVDQVREALQAGERVEVISFNASRGQW